VFAFPLLAGFLFTAALEPFIADRPAMAAAAAAALEPADLIAQRSPGGRGLGATFSVKSRRSGRAAGSEPAERVPAAAPPAEDPLAAGGIPASLPAAFFALPGDPLPVDPPVSDAPFMGGGAVGRPAGVPIFLGGGGFPGGAVPGTTTPPTAVPEPATWATLILGFFFIGSILRRRAHLARQ
jgi:hypothetical protein